MATNTNADERAGVSGEAASRELSRVATLTVPRLLVFLHFAVKQRAMQRELQAALAGLVITAVGRVGDFDRAREEGHDAIMSLPEVLTAHGLSPTLRGYRQGTSDEVYALVGVDKKPDSKQVRTVGALDLLGREGTTAFVRRLLEAESQVERVTKVEDLVALLQMERVDAVVLPLRLLAEIRSTTRLSLVATELAARVGLPAVASIGLLGERASAAVARLPAAVCQALGVDTWR